MRRHPVRAEPACPEPVEGSKHERQCAHVLRFSQCHIPFTLRQAQGERQRNTICAQHIRSPFDKLRANGKIGAGQVIERPLFVAPMQSVRTAMQSVGAAIQSVRTATAPAKPPVFLYSAPRFSQYSKYLVKIQPLLPLKFYIIFECTFMQPQNYGRAPHSAIDALPVTLGKGRAMPRGLPAVTLRRAGR